MNEKEKKTNETKMKATIMTEAASRIRCNEKLKKPKIIHNNTLLNFSPHIDICQVPIWYCRRSNSENNERKHNHKADTQFQT
jgi:hypothetical protein